MDFFISEAAILGPDQGYDVFVGIETGVSRPPQPWHSRWYND
jgi:hypothetical protein